MQSCCAETDVGSGYQPFTILHNCSNLQTLHADNMWHNAAVLLLRLQALCVAMADILPCTKTDDGLKCCAHWYAMSFVTLLYTQCAGL